MKNRELHLETPTPKAAPESAGARTASPASGSGPAPAPAQGPKSESGPAPASTQASRSGSGPAPASTQASAPALADAVRRGAAYIERHGTDIDRAWLSVLLRERSAEALLQMLADRQRRDGALPDWREGSEDPLAGTLRALALLDDIGLLDHPTVEGAVRWLAGGQAEDGGFGDAGAPRKARLLRSGETAGFLAKSPFVRVSLLKRAEAYLVAQRARLPEGASHYGALLAFTHLLVNFSSEGADDVLQWCGRELEHGFRSGRIDPVAVARVFRRARARALPGASISAQEVVDALLAVQREDGSFESADTAPLDATLEALAALQRLA